MFGRKLPHLSPYIRFALHIPDYTKCHHVVISHDESHSLMSSNLVRTDQEFFFTICNVLQAGLVSTELCLACVQPPLPPEGGGICTQATCARPPSQPSQLSHLPPPTKYTSTPGLGALQIRIREQVSNVLILKRIFFRKFAVSTVGNLR